MIERNEPQQENDFVNHESENDPMADCAEIIETIKEKLHHFDFTNEDENNLIKILSSGNERSLDAAQVIANDMWLSDNEYIRERGYDIVYRFGEDSKYHNYFGKVIDNIGTCSIEGEHGEGSNFVNKVKQCRDFATKICSNGDSLNMLRSTVYSVLLSRSIDSSDAEKWRTELVYQGVGELINQASTSVNGFEKNKNMIVGLIRYKEFFHLGEELIISIIAQFNINPDRVYDSWVNSNLDAWGNRFKNDNFLKIVEKNLTVLESVEKKIPGGAKRLFDEFGIRTFGRYNANDLISQLEDIEDVDRPYGLVIFPREDHNGAFYRVGDVISSLIKQSKQKEILTRIIEVGDKVQIYRFISKFDQKYGSKENKIQFSILGGHGSKDSIRFDKKKYKIDGSVYRGTALTTDDLFQMADNIERGRKRREYIKSAFVPNPSILLVACSTGERGGVAQNISRVFESSVVAPQTATHIKEIVVSGELGSIKLHAVYYQDEKGVFNTGVEDNNSDNIY